MTYKIKNLSFAYSKNHLVIDRLSLDIRAGEFTAIVGPNGAGKSTLLKLVAGLQKGFTGSVELFGRSIRRWKPIELARKVAFVPQETHVVFPFRVEEMVLMGRLPYRRGIFFDPGTEVEVARRAMALTNTLSLAGKTFNELSGGERQRVVLASALAQAPEVLLLDEPTVYLDMKHQLEIYQILERLNREARMTIVAVTHDINLAAPYALRMIAISQGKLAADGTPETVLTKRTLHEIFQVNADVITGPRGGTYVIPSS